MPSSTKKRAASSSSAKQEPFRAMTLQEIRHESDVYAVRRMYSSSNNSAPQQLGEHVSVRQHSVRAAAAMSAALQCHASFGPPLLLPRIQRVPEPQEQRDQQEQQLRQTASTPSLSQLRVGGSLRPQQVADARSKQAQLEQPPPRPRPSTAEARKQRRSSASGSVIAFLDADVKYNVADDDDDDDEQGVAVERRLLSANDGGEADDQSSGNPSSRRAVDDADTDHDVFAKHVHDKDGFPIPRLADTSLTLEIVHVGVANRAMEPKDLICLHGLCRSIVKPSVLHFSAGVVFESQRSALNVLHDLAFNNKNISGMLFGGDSNEAVSAAAARRLFPLFPGELEPILARCDENRRAVEAQHQEQLRRRQRDLRVQAKRELMRSIDGILKNEERGRFTLESDERRARAFIRIEQGHDRVRALIVQEKRERRLAFQRALRDVQDDEAAQRYHVQRGILLDVRVMFTDREIFFRAEVEHGFRAELKAFKRMEKDIKKAHDAVAARQRQRDEFMRRVHIRLEGFFRYLRQKALMRKLETLLTDAFVAKEHVREMVQSRVESEMRRAKMAVAKKEQDRQRQLAEDQRRHTQRVAFEDQCFREQEQEFMLYQAHMDRLAMVRAEVVQTAKQARRLAEPFLKKLAKRNEAVAKFGKLLSAAPVIRIEKTVQEVDESSTSSATAAVAATSDMGGGGGGALETSPSFSMSFASPGGNNNNSNSPPSPSAVAMAVKTITGGIPGQQTLYVGSECAVFPFAGCSVSIALPFTASGASSFASLDRNQQVALGSGFCQHYEGYLREIPKLDAEVQEAHMALQLAVDELDRSLAASVDRVMQLQRPTGSAAGQAFLAVDAEVRRFYSAIREYAAGRAARQPPVLCSAMPSAAEVLRAKLLPLESSEVEAQVFVRESAGDVGALSSQRFARRSRTADEETALFAPPDCAGSDSAAAASVVAPEMESLFDSAAHNMNSTVPPHEFSFDACCDKLLEPAFPAKTLFRFEHSATDLLDLRLEDVPFDCFGRAAVDVCNGGGASAAAMVVAPPHDRVAGFIPAESNSSTFQGRRAWACNSQQVRPMADLRLTSSSPSSSFAPPVPLLDPARFSRWVHQIGVGTMRLFQSPADFVGIGAGAPLRTVIAALSVTARFAAFRPKLVDFFEAAECAFCFSGPLVDDFSISRGFLSSLNSAAAGTSQGDDGTGGSGSGLVAVPQRARGRTIAASAAPPPALTATAAASPTAAPAASVAAPSEERVTAHPLMPPSLFRAMDATSVEAWAGTAAEVVVRPPIVWMHATQRVLRMELPELRPELFGPGMLGTAPEVLQLLAGAANGALPISSSSSQTAHLAPFVPFPMHPLFPPKLCYFSVPRTRLSDGFRLLVKSRRVSGRGASSGGDVALRCGIVLPGIATQLAFTADGSRREIIISGLHVAYIASANTDIIAARAVSKFAPPRPPASSNSDHKQHQRGGNEQQQQHPSPHSALFRNVEKQFLRDAGAEEDLILCMHQRGSASRDADVLVDIEFKPDKSLIERLGFSALVSLVASRIVMWAERPSADAVIEAATAAPIDSAIRSQLLHDFAVIPPTFFNIQVEGLVGGGGAGGTSSTAPAAAAAAQSTWMSVCVFRRGPKPHLSFDASRLNWADRVVAANAAAASEDATVAAAGSGEATKRGGSKYDIPADIADVDEFHSRAAETTIVMRVPAVTPTATNASSLKSKNGNSSNGASNAVTIALFDDAAISRHYDPLRCAVPTQFLDSAAAAPSTSFCDSARAFGSRIGSDSSSSHPTSPTRTTTSPTTPLRGGGIVPLRPGSSGAAGVPPAARRSAHAQQPQPQPVFRAASAGGPFHADADVDAEDVERAWSAAHRIEGGVIRVSVLDPEQPLLPPRSGGGGGAPSSPVASFLGGGGDGAAARAAMLASSFRFDSDVSSSSPASSTAAILEQMMHQTLPSALPPPSAAGKKATPTVFDSSAAAAAQRNVLLPSNDDDSGERLCVVTDFAKQSVVSGRDCSLSQWEAPFELELAAEEGDANGGSGSGAQNAPKIYNVVDKELYETVARMVVYPYHVDIEILPSSARNAVDKSNGATSNKVSFFDDDDDADSIAQAETQSVSSLEPSFVAAMIRAVCFKTSRTPAVAARRFAVTMKLLWCSSLEDQRRRAVSAANNSASDSNRALWSPTSTRTVLLTFAPSPFVVQPASASAASSSEDLCSTALATSTPWRFKAPLGTGRCCRFWYQLPPPEESAAAPSAAAVVSASEMQRLSDCGVSLSHLAGAVHPAVEAVLPASPSTPLPGSTDGLLLAAGNAIVFELDAKQGASFADGGDGFAIKGRDPALTKFGTRISAATIAALAPKYLRDDIGLAVAHVLERVRARYEFCLGDTTAVVDVDADPDALQVLEHQAMVHNLSLSSGGSGAGGGGAAGSSRRRSSVAGASGSQLPRAGASFLLDSERGGGGAGAGGSGVFGPSRGSAVNIVPGGRAGSSLAFNTGAAGGGSGVFGETASIGGAVPAPALPPTKILYDVYGGQFRDGNFVQAMGAHIAAALKSPRHAVSSDISLRELTLHGSVCALIVVYRQVMLLLFVRESGTLLTKGDISNLLTKLLFIKCPTPSPPPPILTAAAAAAAAAAASAAPAAKAGSSVAAAAAASTMSAPAVGTAQSTASSALCNHVFVDGRTPQQRMANRPVASRVTSARKLLRTAVIDSTVVPRVWESEVDVVYCLNTTQGCSHAAAAIREKEKEKSAQQDSSAAAAGPQPKTTDLSILDANSFVPLLQLRPTLRCLETGAMLGAGARGPALDDLAPLAGLSTRPGLAKAGRGVQIASLTAAADGTRRQFVRSLDPAFGLYLFKFGAEPLLHWSEWDANALFAHCSSAWATALATPAAPTTAASSAAASPPPPTVRFAFRGLRVKISTTIGAGGGGGGNHPHVGGTVGILDPAEQLELMRDTVFAAHDLESNLPRLRQQDLHNSGCSAAKCCKQWLESQATVSVNARGELVFNNDGFVAGRVVESAESFVVIEFGDFAHLFAQADPHSQAAAKHSNSNAATATDDWFLQNLVAACTRTESAASGSQLLLSPTSQIELASRSVSASAASPNAVLVPHASPASPTAAGAAATATSGTQAQQQARLQSAIERVFLVLGVWCWRPRPQRADAQPERPVHPNDLPGASGGKSPLRGAALQAALAAFAEFQALSDGISVDVSCSYRTSPDVTFGRFSVRILPPPTQQDRAVRLGAVLAANASAAASSSSPAISSSQSALLGATLSGTVASMMTALQLADAPFHAPVGVAPPFGMPPSIPLRRQTFFVGPDIAASSTGKETRVTLLATSTQIEPTLLAALSVNPECNIVLRFQYVWLQSLVVPNTNNGGGVAASSSPDRSPSSPALTAAAAASAEQKKFALDPDAAGVSSSRRHPGFFLAPLSMTAVNPQDETDPDMKRMIEWMLLDRGEEEGAAAAARSSCAHQPSLLPQVRFQLPKGITIQEHEGGRILCDGKAAAMLTSTGVPATLLPALKYRLGTTASNSEQQQQQKLHMLQKQLASLHLETSVRILPGAGHKVPMTRVKVLDALWRGAHVVVPGDFVAPKPAVAVATSSSNGNNGSGVSALSLLRELSEEQERRHSDAELLRPGAAPATIDDVRRTVRGAALLESLCQERDDPLTEPARARQAQKRVQELFEPLPRPAHLELVLETSVAAQLAEREALLMAQQQQQQQQAPHNSSFSQGRRGSRVGGGGAGSRPSSGGSGTGRNPSRFGAAATAVVAGIAMSRPSSAATSSGGSVRGGGASSAALLMQQTTASSLRSATAALGVVRSCFDRSDADAERIAAQRQALLPFRQPKPLGILEAVLREQRDVAEATGAAVGGGSNLLVSKQLCLATTLLGATDPIVILNRVM